MRTVNKTFTWALVYSGLLVGCATVAPVDEQRAQAIQACKQKIPAAEKIQVQSVSMGCMASMAFSKAIGSNNPAPLICMAGGASGFLLGESITERKCNYATQAEQLDGELAHAKKMNAGFAIVLAQKSTELSALELMAQGLKQQQAAASAQTEQSKHLEASINADIADNQTLLKQARDEFKFKQQTLAASKGLKQQATEDELLAEIRALQKNLKQLQESNAKFNQLGLALAES